MANHLFQEVNQKNSYGQTALHLAAHYNDLAQVKLLLELGADVNSRDLDNRTPLLCAAAYNKLDSHFDTIEALLMHGSPVNALNIDGSTPLHCLAWLADVRTIDLLLKFGADVRIKNYRGEIALLEAIRVENFEVIKLLVSRGSDVNSRSFDGKTPLHWACMYCKIDIIKFFLKCGTRLDALDSFGHTPLLSMLKHFSHKNSEVKLRYLVEHSEVDTIDTLGYSALCYTKNRNNLVSILKHVAKLKTLGVVVHLDFMDKITNSEECQKIFKVCEDELELAKKTKFQNSWITFYDLLVSRKKNLKNYAGNKDIVQDFKKSNCRNKFPIYGATIYKNFNKGIRIRKMFDKSALVLSKAMPVFGPSHLVVRNVLDHLIFKDYSRLVKDV